MYRSRRIIGVNMDKMIGIFLEEITKFWEKVKSYVKDKIKKIICKCKCTERKLKTTQRKAIVFVSHIMRRYVLNV
jgi:NurA-like 5'-3' nuclease